MSFEIEYKGDEASWFSLEFQSDNGNFTLDISFMLDPFEDWFYALERINMFVTPSIIIDTEGVIFRIDFIKATGVEYNLRVFNHETNEIVFSSHTTQQKILQEMYVKLMDFVGNEKYEPRQYGDGGNPSGFSLRNYQNSTIDKLLDNTLSQNKLTLTNCKYCNQVTLVKTISDMLQQAYKIIDDTDKISQLLRDLHINKNTIGITQECSRLTKVKYPQKSILNNYRVVQESESGIYLGFNENFTLLEVIEIKPGIFGHKHTNAFGTNFRDLSDKEKLDALDLVFSNYSQNLSGINDYLEVKYLQDYLNSELTLPNQRLNDSKANAYYPNTNVYPYYKFEINDNSKEGQIYNITIKLCETYAVNEPITTWLSQTVVTMGVEYGGVYLWFDGAAGDVSSIPSYNLENTKLAKQLENWCQELSGNVTQNNFRLNEFNKVGRELFLQLRNRIKEDYIVTYCEYFKDPFEESNTV